GVEDSEAFHLRAVSVGDCCLLLFKASGEVVTFPMQHSDEFGVNPVLLGNRLPRPAHYDRWEGRVEPGDMILLGTDAVSKWTLQCLERRRSGLLFESLRGFFGAGIDDSDSAPDATPLPDSSPEEQLPAATQNTDQPARRSGWLSRLWSWSSPQPLEVDEITEPNDVPPPLPESDAAEQPPAEPTEAQAAIDSSLEFAQFIERFRAPDSALHMRNDDSTLVVCLPLGQTNDQHELEALRVIRRLESAVAARLQASTPTGEEGGQADER